VRVGHCQASIKNPSRSILLGFFYACRLGYINILSIRFQFRLALSLLFDL